jgi:hypothetical protein
MGGQRGGYNNNGGGRGGFNNNGGGGQGQFFQKTNQSAGGSNYKTVKCRHYEQYGSCKYGDKCSYAHGDEDLRGSDNGGGGM